MVYFLCKAYDSDRQNCYFALSLPVQGAWIEMKNRVYDAITVWSLPVQGAWIEIATASSASRANPCRSPCRERGLKYRGGNRDGFRPCGRSPCRERGLKSRGCKSRHDAYSRSPCRERGLKCYIQTCKAGTRESLPVQGAWIEMRRLSPLRLRKWSLPVQGAWIEIAAIRRSIALVKVAPRAGSVD